MSMFKSSLTIKHHKDPFCAKAFNTPKRKDFLKSESEIPKMHFESIRHIIAK